MARVNIVISVWKGSNTQSRAGQSLAFINHSKLTVQLLGTNINRKRSWTRSTIPNPFSYPLVPYRFLPTDSTINKISEQLKNNRSVQWVTHVNFNNDREAVKKFNYLESEIKTLNSRRQGRHSISGCNYIASILLDKSKRNVDGWVVQESGAKRINGELKPVEKIIGGNHTYIDFMEYSAQSLEHNLKLYGFIKMN